jgi:hypothetical protein
MVVIIYVGIVAHHLPSNILNLLGFSKLGEPSRLKPWQRTMAARLARERLTYTIEYRCVTCLGPQRLTVRISYAVAAVDCRALAAPPRQKYHIVGTLEVGQALEAESLATYHGPACLPSTREPP